ncbi:MAG: DUF4175 family protein [Enhygromyxa sp.]
MALAEAQLLRDYLRAVRRVALRRALGTFVIDLALLMCAWAGLVIGFAGLSLRGDLAANVGAALGLLGAAGLIHARIRQLRERLGGPIALAREIAAEAAPLRERPTPREREADVILRHELLGATELWVQLETQASSSPELAAAYVRRIGEQTLSLDPRRALARPRRAVRGVVAMLVLGLGVALASSSLGARGLELVRERADARPPIPPQPIWTSLELVLDYPDYTRRPDRRVPNPSGTLRVPAGTRVELDMELSEDADSVRVVLVHDGVELGSAPEPEIIELDPHPEPGDERRFTGSFVVRSSGTWVVALLDDLASRDAATLLVAARRSPPMRLELEPDAGPEVELLPLPDWQRQANETDKVDLRFAARDDFGVVAAELVYEIAKPDGEIERHRLPAGRAPAGSSRAWRHRHSWDLSAIPLEDRSEVTYWIEVRDNDPGLGLRPLIDGPGKLAASARQRLLVHDEEAEHAANIADLQTIRDVAVDLLAARLTTAAFSELDAEARLGGKLRTARDLHTGAATLLTMIAATVDALAVDTMIAEREVETLAGVHERLLALHRDEAKLHERIPPGAELDRHADRGPLLHKLGAHNRREIEQLEDEIIRLDDLVDGLIIARLEALMARLQVSQQKLVEKLEQLQAGDQSVRPEIEQLEQRIRDDMRRVQEAQAQLRKEVGDEWMNLDAFKAMEARMRSQQLLEQLRRGDVEGALKQAREGLDAIRQLRERVQRTGEEQETPALSEEDRKRMKMLRELSRLQDEQTGLRSETRRLREQWRDAVRGRQAEAPAAERAREQAKQVREALEAINDAHLSRDGRSAWEDAREALEALEAATADEQASELELFEAANDAAAALRRAEAGSKPGESEAKALRKLAGEAERLRDRLREPLPDPDEVLEREDIERLSELGRQQRTLRERARQLLEDPAADILPTPGRSAMDGADRAMREAGEALEDAALEGALLGENRAWQGIQRAIDSLRQSSPPPPRASEGESSTEAERDRSLRDQVVEAMREGDRDGFDSDTKRYYEELLR